MAVMLTVGYDTSNYVYSLCYTGSYGSYNMKIMKYVYLIRKPAYIHIIIALYNDSMARD